MRLLPKNKTLGWTRYVWLIYVASLFIQPGVTGLRRDWLLTVAAVILFLPLYFIGHWRQGRRLLPVIGAILVLGLVFSPWNPGAVCFFIYAAAFVGEAARPAVGARYLVFILALLALETSLIGIPRFAWAWGLLFCLIVGGINIHFAEVARGTAKLRLAHDEVERLATQAERERIARDLHDLLGHTLSLITIKAGLAARLAATDPERAEVEMREIETVSRQAMAEVRRTVQGYRFLSLGGEVARAKIALAAAGVELKITSAPYDLDAQTESAIAQALREGVTNVVRHAGAHSCRIDFRQHQDDFTLSVSDDGKGGQAAEGNGLAGMRERIESLGGKIDRNGKRGTALTVTVPVHPPPDRHAPELAAAR